MRYLLTFKPLKHFFFGNNKTFSQDYVAKSEYFPQPTQLLGALRLFIAEQNNLMSMHKNGKYSNHPEELKKLIGDAKSDDFYKNDNLGVIKNLSSMFIVDKSLDDAYFFTPLDIEISKNHIKKYTLENFEDEYFLSDYDIKNSSFQHLAGSEFWKDYIEDKELKNNSIKSFDSVFVTHTQVGIALEGKKTIDGAFYSKVDYTLDKEYLFACVVELEEDVIKNGIINLGAESSLFELNIKKLQDTNLAQHIIISHLFKMPTPTSKVVAISETIADTKEFKAKFHITPFYKNFAMIKSNKAYTKFAGKTKNSRLIPNGSVFYTPQTLPKAKNAYAKMGFNQFISINGEKNV